MTQGYQTCLRAFIVFTCRLLRIQTGIETGRITRAQARGSERKHGKCAKRRGYPD